MHKLLTRLMTIAVATVFAGCTTVQNEFHDPGMQKPNRFKTRLTRAVQLDYLLHLPPGYSDRGAKQWPLLLFLHGSGERGTNVQKVAVHGPPKLVKTQPDFPFVLVAPQCPPDRTWQDDELLALLDHIIAKHKIDTNRVYVTGLSMGGYGTWSLGTKHPERFAAMAPICGGGEQIPVLLASPARKRALQSMGVWAFHGARDLLVPVEESQRMTNALMRAGCRNVKLTVYPDLEHDSWTRAYGEPEIWNWFLSHSRQ